MQTSSLLNERSDILIDILCRIRESCKDDDLLVIGINRMGKLLSQVFYQHLQFAVVHWCDVFEHRQQQAKDFLIGFEVALPRAAIHICQLHTSLFTSY